MALVLSWLAWHVEKGEQIELRLDEPKEPTVYVVGLLLKRGAIYVQYVRAAPKLLNKVLHHWYCTTTYQTMSVQDIKDSVENPDILNMLNVVCETSKDINDSDLEL